MNLSHLSSYDHNHRKVTHFACSFDFPNASYFFFQVFSICASAPFWIPLMCRCLKKWEKYRVAVVAVMTGRKVSSILSYVILKICIRNLLGCIRYYEFIIIAIYNKQVNLDPHDVLMIYLLKPVCSFWVKYECQYNYEIGSFWRVQ